MMPKNDRAMSNTGRTAQSMMQSVEEMIPKLFKKLDLPIFFRFCVQSITPLLLLLFLSRCKPSLLGCCVKFGLID